MKRLRVSNFYRFLLRFHSLKVKVLSSVSQEIANSLISIIISQHSICSGRKYFHCRFSRFRNFKLHDLLLLFLFKKNHGLRMIYYLPFTMLHFTGTLSEYELPWRNPRLLFVRISNCSYWQVRVTKYPCLC